MGKPAGRPPVLGATAVQVKAWIDDLVKHAAGLLLEGGDDVREIALMRAAAARFVAQYARELEKRCVGQAQEAGASNEAVAYALGVRPQTSSRLYPNPRRPVTWKTRRDEGK